MSDIVRVGVIGIILAGFVIFALSFWASLPIVQFNQYGNCVAVIGNGSCQNLPVKYLVEYVP